MSDSLRPSKEEGVFQSQPRFSIMYLLFLKRRVGFTELKKLLELTPGNLDHHIRKLEKAGLVKSHRIVSWKPLVVVEITDSGRDIFRGYIFKLKRLLKDVPEKLFQEQSEIDEQ